MDKVTLAQGQEIFKLVLQSEISKESLQALLESGEFTTLLKKFKKNIITLSVRVDYNRTPKEVIDATGRVKYVNEKMLETMSASVEKGIKNNVQVTFFKFLNSRNQIFNDAELAAAYEKLGLKPDPYALAAVNEAHPEFADKYPNCTHWKADNDNWCFIGFKQEGNKRFVLLRSSYGSEWNNEGWWFGGVTK